MTGASKFLLTGLGGVGVITATGYGVYYDANNKKIEKNDDSKNAKTQQNQSSTQSSLGQNNNSQAGNNDGKLSQQQTATSNTGSETDIQKLESSSEEEATTSKLSETSSETEVKEPSENGITEHINSNSGGDGQGSFNSGSDIERDDSENGKGTDHEQQ